MAKSNSSTIKDIAIVAGVAGGGLLLYKALKGGSSSSTTQVIPQSQYDASALYQAFSSLLSTLPQHMQQQSSSDEGGGSSTPTTPTPTLPDVNQVFTDMTSALNAMGYNGFFAQKTQLDEWSHAENVQEALNGNPITAALEYIGGGATEISMKEQGRDYNSYKLATIGTDWSKLLRPSTYTDAYDNAQNLITSAKTWWKVNVKKEPIVEESASTTTETTETE